MSIEILYEGVNSFLKVHKYTKVSKSTREGQLFYIKCPVYNSTLPRMNAFLLLLC